MVKNKIKDLYSPFRCPKLLSDHSEGLIFAMVGRQFRTSLHIEMCFYLVFLPFFIIYLNVKWFLTDFEFFFNEKFSPPLPLLLLIQNGSFIGVK